MKTGHTEDEEGYRLYNSGLCCFISFTFFTRPRYSFMSCLFFSRIVSQCLEWYLWLRALLPQSRPSKRREQYFLPLFNGIHLPQCRQSVIFPNLFSSSKNENTYSNATPVIAFGTLLVESNDVGHRAVQVLQFMISKIPCLCVAQDRCPNWNLTLGKELHQFCICKWRDHSINLFRPPNEHEDIGNILGSIILLVYDSEAQGSTSHVLP